MTSSVTFGRIPAESHLPPTDQTGRLSNRKVSHKTPHDADGVIAILATIGALTAVAGIFVMIVAGSKLHVAKKIQDAGLIKEFKKLREIGGIVTGAGIILLVKSIVVSCREGK